MKTLLITILTLSSLLLSTGCRTHSSSSAESKIVEKQQSQYAKGQPVPVYDWSLERDLVIKLYNLRNQKVSTHTVWRSDYGMIEGDCTSIGYGIPYDTSLTNPLVSVDRSGNKKVGDVVDYSLTSVGQPEPNGIFASTNTAATWVMCVGTSGNIEPVYVEAKVTTYSRPVKIDYKTNRVIPVGKATATIKLK